MHDRPIFALLFPPRDLALRFEVGDELFQTLQGFLVIFFEQGGKDLVIMVGYKLRVLEIESGAVIEKSFRSFEAFNIAWQHCCFLSFWLILLI